MASLHYEKNTRSAKGVAVRKTPWCVRWREEGDKQRTRYFANEAEAEDFHAAVTALQAAKKANKQREAALDAAREIEELRAVERAERQRLTREFNEFVSG